MEQPKEYTPEEIEALAKSRVISDAEMLKDGAKYVTNEQGDLVLQSHERNIQTIEGDVLRESPEYKKFAHAAIDFFHNTAIKMDDSIEHNKNNRFNEHNFIHSFPDESQQPLSSLPLSDNSSVWFQSGGNTTSGNVGGLRINRSGVEPIDVHTSLEEFYSALLSEELEKGKEIGKVIEGYME